MNIKRAKQEIKKTFPKEAELSEKSRRLQELDRILNLDQPELPELTDEPAEPQQDETKTKEVIDRDVR